MIPVTENIDFDVSNSDVAAEVAIGIIGRARQLHNNPDDDLEDVALELRDIGQKLLAEHEETYE